VVTGISSQEWLERPGSVGRATFQCDVAIHRDDGSIASVGESGAIYMRNRRGVSLRYHNDAVKTESAHREGGWFTTGDVGWLDADDYLHLTDRKIDMIISGGVNIYPQEAENALVTHPKVIDVAVFGVPNDDFGEEVKAVVQPATMPESAEAARALELELIAYCKSQLADVKCPRSIDFRAELPRHPTGKLYKRLLKDEYWKNAGRSI
jgi:long-chain acyl-CoA synthetase